MSNSATSEPIQNAVGIIEAFGGIRPMSAKVNVAVTTIQGWKKRDAIPANRKAAVFKAAKEHNIDLSAFFDDAPSVAPVEDIAEQDKAEVENFVKTLEKAASEDVQDEEVVNPTANEKSQESIKPIDRSPNEFSALPRQKVTHADFTELAVKTEKRAITKSAMIAAAMVILVVGALIGMLWPDYEEFDQHGTRLSSLEGEVSDLKSQQSAFKGLVPEDWAEQLAELKQQAMEAKQMVGETMHSVQVASQDIMATRGLDDRVEKLQTYVSEITGTDRFASLTKRFDSMSQSYAGLKIGDESVAMLNSVFKQSGNKDVEQVNSMLDVARQKNQALGQTFEGVPQNELKAAAMLFALTQVRSALNRDEKDFDGDLQLLMNMVGEEDTTLKTSLQKIAPYSKSEILSFGGLKEEFQTVAGDTITASLRGEDVSFTEKMSAKMNEILQVEKDGELVSGTETQATLKKAEKMVESNNWEEALKLLKKQLKAKELEPLRPWIKQVEAALNKREVKKLIDQAIDLSTGSGYLGGSQLIEQE